ncbi:MAG: flavodoxin family protein [Nitrospirae bacterium]|nr:flavodoxin family protein [Nitrospirota bacterium]
MKIISIVGSPHGIKGNTARLLRVVLDGAESQGAETEIVLLPGGTVLPCKGCNTCHKKGRCPQKDDFESIKQKILESDGLVLASPNYIFSVSAQMKTFMDRCCGVIHCMAFEGKYGASVVTSGGGDEKPITDYLNHFLMITGIRPVGSVWATMGTIVGKTFPVEVNKQALDLGKKLVQSWKNKITFPKIEKGLDEFKERMRSLILYRKEEWPYEYEYWKKHHGLI